MTHIPKTGLLEFRGQWDLKNNNPQLSDNNNDDTGTIYKVISSGTFDFGSGPIQFNIDDFIFKNNSGLWEKFASQNLIYGEQAKLLQLTTTNTQNINQSSPVSIQWNSTILKDSAFDHDVSANNSKITIGEDGTYKIYVNIAYDGDSQNISTKLNIRKNGTKIDGEGNTGYVSGVNGLTTATNNLSTIVEAVSGDIFEVTAEQNGNSGAAILRENESLIYFEKITGNDIQTVSNAQSLGGKNPNDFVKKGGNLKLAEREVSDSDSIYPNDYAIFANASSKNITLKLPAAEDVLGQSFSITKTDASQNSVTISGSTINNDVTRPLTSQFESITVQSDGNVYFKIFESDTKEKQKNRFTVEFEPNSFNEICFTSYWDLVFDFVSSNIDVTIYDVNQKKVLKQGDFVPDGDLIQVTKNESISQTEIVTVVFYPKEQNANVTSPQNADYRYIYAIEQTEGQVRVIDLDGGMSTLTSISLPPLSGTNSNYRNIHYRPYDKTMLVVPNNKNPIQVIDADPASGTFNQIINAFSVSIDVKRTRYDWVKDKLIGQEVDTNSNRLVFINPDNGSISVDERMFFDNLTANFVHFDPISGMYSLSPHISDQTELIFQRNFRVLRSSTGDLYKLFYNPHNYLFYASRPDFVDVFELDGKVMKLKTKLEAGFFGNSSGMVLSYHDNKILLFNGQDYLGGTYIYDSATHTLENEVGAGPNGDKNLVSVYSFYTNKSYNHARTAINEFDTGSATFTDSLLINADGVSDQARNDERMAINGIQIGW